MKNLPKGYRIQKKRSKFNDPDQKWVYRAQYKKFGLFWYEGPFDYHRNVKKCVKDILEHYEEQQSDFKKWKEIDGTEIFTDLL